MSDDRSEEEVTEVSDGEEAAPAEEAAEVSDGEEAAPAEEAAEVSDGEAAEAAAAPEPAKPAKPERDPLEEVGDKIDRARAVAEENLGDTERKFVESGDERSREEDDQTIAPPG